MEHLSDWHPFNSADPGTYTKVEAAVQVRDDVTIETWVHGGTISWISAHLAALLAMGRSTEMANAYSTTRVRYRPMPILRLRIPMRPTLHRKLFPSSKMLSTVLKAMFEWWCCCHPLEWFVCRGPLQSKKY
jgi:hypothetical protein